MIEHEPHNVLITGGAGFIGSNFVRYLLLATNPDVNVVNLDLLTHAGSLENLENLPDPSRHTFIQGDICGRRLVDWILREHSVDTVINFAAETHVDRSIAAPSIFVRANMMGTFTLLEAVCAYWLSESPPSRSVRFHHVSSDEVFGTLGPGDPKFTEATPYAPNSPYSATKAASDHLVRAYHHTYGLPTITTNCSNNYGPYQHFEKFIPTIIRACLLGKPIPVYGDGSNIRDWLYVGDHCRAIDVALRRGRQGGTYNIGGNNEWSNIEIARLVCRLMDGYNPQDAPHERLITFVKDRPGHDWRYALDISRIQAQLGWRPKETFETGIRKTIAWYLEWAKRVKR